MGPLPAPTSLKVIGKALADGLAAYSSGTLEDCSVRYGPQHSIVLADGEVGFVVVRWTSLNPEGVAYAGNAWEEWPVFLVSVYVPDATGTEGTTAEDRRTDIVDDILSFLQSNRTIAAGVQAAHATTTEADEVPGMTDESQVFRSAALAVTCHRIRS